jgi:hypothetical protein
MNSKRTTHVPSSSHKPATGNRGAPATAVPAIVITESSSPPKPRRQNLISVSTANGPKRETQGLARDAHLANPSPKSGEWQLSLAYAQAAREVECPIEATAAPNESKKLRSAGVSNSSNSNTPNRNSTCATTPTPSCFARATSETSHPLLDKGVTSNRPESEMIAIITGSSSSSKVAGNERDECSQSEHASPIFPRGLRSSHGYGVTPEHQTRRTTVSA